MSKSSNRRSDEILKKQQAKQEQRLREDAEAEPYRLRSAERRSAYDNMRDIFFELLRNTRDKQEFANAYAIAIITFAQKEFSCPIGDLRPNGDDARDYAIEILDAASKGKTKEVVRLLLALMQSYASVPPRGFDLWDNVIDQLHKVGLELMSIYKSAEMVPIWSGRKLMGNIGRFFPGPASSPEQCRQSMLQAALNAIEHYRAELAQGQVDPERATSLAYLTNAWEKELWPGTPPLREGSYFLGDDVLPAVNALRDRIRAELGETPVTPSLEVPPKGKRSGGRKPDTDPKDDKRIYDGWKKSGCRTFEEYAATCGRVKRDVKKAVDRHEKRMISAKEE